MSNRTIIINLLSASDGGHITRARSFLERLRNYDSESTIIVVKQKGLLEFCDLQRNDMEVVNISFPRNLLRAFFRMSWEAFNLPRMVKERNVNCLLSFSTNLPRMLPAELTSIVVVSNLAPFSQDAYTAESSYFHRLRLATLRKTILSSAKRADRVIALSNICKQILMRYGIPEAKIFVIPNGLNEIKGPSGNHNTSIVKQYDTDEKYLLCVSHFYSYKNFERLIEAYALLPKAIRDEYKLLLVGAPLDKKYFDKVSSKIKKMKLQSRVHIVPGVPHEDLPRLYSNAFLFIFPSLIENCPNILLEAMQCGARVISSNVDPMPEFGGDAVIYFDPFSAHDIARKITNVVENGYTIDNLRSKAIMQAAKFTWDNFTSKVVDLYR